MNAASSAMPTARAAIVSGAAQPCVSALERPYTRPTRPADAVTAPGMSMSRFAVEPVSRPRRRSAAIAVGMARITFTYMHQRQSRYSVSAPPRIRPTAAPEPAIAPNTKRPVALGRRGEGGGQQTEGRRGQQRGEAALRGAGDHEDSETLGKTAERRGPSG